MTGLAMLVPALLGAALIVGATRWVWGVVPGAGPQGGEAVMLGALAGCLLVLAPATRVMLRRWAARTPTGVAGALGRAVLGLVAAFVVLGVQLWCFGAAADAAPGSAARIAWILAWLAPSVVALTAVVQAVRRR